MHFGSVNGQQHLLVGENVLGKCSQVFTVHIKHIQVKPGGGAAPHRRTITQTGRQRDDLGGLTFHLSPHEGMPRHTPLHHHKVRGDNT